MNRIFVMFPDMDKQSFYPAEVVIDEGKIGSVQKMDEMSGKGEAFPYMLPGFIDAHIHIESSMLSPSRFAEIAVKHGTVATVSDPHEIANVLGVGGVNYMLEEAERVPLKIYYTAPSCVPATDFEVAGARMDANNIAEILKSDHIVALGEMMNFPGVIYDDKSVIAKIEATKKSGKPIDGHAPGVRGDDLKKYVSTGISTDHEAVDIAEALEKIELGMKILIREGSAAKNFEALKTLLIDQQAMVMLCSDDLHPDDLLKGHINVLVKRALELGISIFDLIKIYSANPIRHYGLNVGQLKIDDPGDFILVDSPENLNVLSTWIDGIPVYNDEKTLFQIENPETPNKFISEKLKIEDFAFAGSEGKFRVIDAVDGSLITLESEEFLESSDGFVQADPDKDVLKIAVVNRYEKAKPSIAWIRNIGLKRGAIASSVAHDSHNIIVVGCSDMEILLAVNSLIESKGGIVVVDGQEHSCLPLPVAGIMSDNLGTEVASAYTELSILAKNLGSELKAPFMTLSFMALLVIPDLKIGDKGLFDVRKFDFVKPRID